MKPNDNPLYRQSKPGNAICWKFGLQSARNFGAQTLIMLPRVNGVLRFNVFFSEQVCRKRKRSSYVANQFLRSALTTAGENARGRMTIIVPEITNRYLPSVTTDTDWRLPVTCLHWHIYGTPLSRHGGFTNTFSSLHAGKIAHEVQN